VLITGGNGFLGQSLFSYIIKNTKHDVYTLSRSKFDYIQHIQCDLLNEKSIRNILNDIQPELIFHLAGNPHVKPDENNPSGVLIENIESTHNLVYNLKNNPRLVFSSSCTVFGYYNKKTPPYYSSPTEPISLYAASKLACENILRVYAKQDKVRPTSIRIPALVGKNPTHGLVKDIIYKLKSNSKTLNLLGNSPGSIKPFCHVDEISQIFFNVGIDKNGFDELGLTCIAGTSDSLSVLRIAEIIMQELKIKKEIEWDVNGVWKGDNQEMYIIPCLKTHSNSEQAIRKAVRESL
jgi:UDP-glucose 4-epimerase